MISEGREEMQDLLQEMVDQAQERLGLSKAQALKAMLDVVSVDQLNMDPEWRTRRVDHAVKAVGEFAQAQLAYKVINALAHPGSGTGGVRTQHEQDIKRDLEKKLAQRK